MDKKALYIRHKTLPGKRDDVMRIWEKYVRTYVEHTDGQIAYVYGFDDNHPDVIVAYQVYTDNVGTEDFVQQPWYQDYHRETAELLAAPSEFRTITPHWIKSAAA